MKGFTLIETLIVLALVAVLAGFGVVFGVDAYERSTFRSHQDFVVSALQKARSRALANIGQCNHGVRLNEGEYTVFVEEDGFCDTEGIFDEEIIVQGDVSIDGPDEVVFLRLSGDVRIDDEEVTIVMTDPNSPNNKEVSVTVGQNGRISWE